MKKLLLSIGLFCGLMCYVSCSDNGQIKMLDLGEAEPLVAAAQWELYSSSVRDLAVIGDELLVFPTKADVAIVLNRFTGTETGKWGQMGKGPGEFRQAHYCNSSNDYDNIWLYDTGYRKLRRYSVGNSSADLKLEEEIDYVSPSFVDRLCVLDNRSVVANLAFSADGYSSPLALMDMGGNIVRPLSQIPDKNHENVKIVKDGNLADYRSYSSVVSCFGNRFVQAMTEYGYLAFFETDRSGNAVLKTDYCIEPVKYKDDNTLDRKQLKYGFIDVKMTGDCVFCSYCGKERSESHLSERLLVFDSRGKLLHHYLLDKQIGSIAVTPDGKTLYADVYSPEVGIAVYHLDL